MKRIDNFIVVVAQCLYRYSNIHKDRGLLEKDLKASYDLISNLSDVKKYSGPLICSDYKLSVPEAYFSLFDLVFRKRCEIIQAVTGSTGISMVNAIAKFKTNHAAIALLTLHYLYGPKILENSVLLDRLGLIHNSDMIVTNDYSRNAITTATLHEFKYGPDTIRKLFAAIEIVDNGTLKVHRAYAVADLFVEVYKDRELPISAPMGTAYYSVTRKAYLRHILHHPDDNKYEGVIRDIYNTADATFRRALYYFTKSVSSKYNSVIPWPTYSTQLARWYNNELNEKQLDDKFDDVITEEKRVFEELGRMGVGISIDANIRLTKRRFARIKKYVENSEISQFKELAGPFLISESSLLACKIIRRQIND